MSAIKFSTKVNGFFIEVPEGSYNHQISKDVNSDTYALMWQNSDDKIGLTPIDGNYQILNISTNLSEEEKRLIIPNVDMTGYGELFQNYDDDEGSLFSDRDDSYASLKKSLGICDVNEFGENEPPLEQTCCGRWVSSRFDENVPECCQQPVPSEQSQHDWYLWNDAQKLVKTYIVIIEKT